MTINIVNITDLKISPSKIIKQAEDYPVLVKKGKQSKAYIVGKEIFEKLISFLEDAIDRQEVEKADFKKALDFEKVAKELGI